MYSPPSFTVLHGCWSGGKLIQKLHQKGVYEEIFSRHAAWIRGKLIQLMHITVVPQQVKTLKIQAEAQNIKMDFLRLHGLTSDKKGKRDLGAGHRAFEPLQLYRGIRGETK
ncbi:hypothetical protein Tco_1384136 [Tanacetum coccineum]